MYDIVSFRQYHSHLPVSCAIFYDFAYDIIYISYTYHTEYAMASVSYDMTHDIRAYKP